MYHDHENQPDALDELLSQLLKDFPDVLPSMTVQPLSLSLLPLSSLSPSSPSSLSPSPPSPSSLPSPSSPSTLASVSSTWSYWSPPPASPYPPVRPRHPEDARSTCRWVFSPGCLVSCGAHLSKDPKEVCMHFRNVHDVHGNEKVIVSCNWRHCHVAPMQRGSLIRHVLTVHLELMKWRCERCQRMFSRKGSAHLCVQDK